MARRKSFDEIRAQVRRIARRSLSKDDFEDWDNGIHVRNDRVNRATNIGERYMRNIASHRGMYELSDNRNYSPKQGSALLYGYNYTDPTKYDRAYYSGIQKRPQSSLGGNMQNGAQNMITTSKAQNHG